MAAAETGTASFQSGISRVTGFVLTTGADAAVVNLREGSVSGTIKFVVKNVTANTTVSVPLSDDGVVSGSGNWYVQLSSGTTPQMTIVGG
jgi:hypothetical protein